MIAIAGVAYIQEQMQAAAPGIIFFQRIFRRI